MTMMEQLSSVTYSLHHNPNCRKPYEVRLVGKGGMLDNKHGLEQTNDIIGYGDTFEVAAHDAWNKKYDKRKLVNEG